MWISIICIYIYIHIGIHISLYLMQTWEREKLGESYSAGNDMKCKVKVCNISGNGNKVRTPNHAFCTVTMTMTWIRYSSYSRTKNCKCELSESFRMIGLLMAAGCWLDGGNSKIFYFHPENWGNDPILSNIFQMGWFNHQPVEHYLIRQGLPRRWRRSAVWRPRPAEREKKIGGWAGLGPQVACACLVWRSI